MDDSTHETVPLSVKTTTINHSGDKYKAWASVGVLGRAVE
jgi:hypothetical protein